MKLITIPLDGSAAVPGSLADGELYLDEAGERMFVQTVYAVVAVPLAVTPVPLPTGDGTVTALKQGESAVYATLSAGGAGRPFDDQPYRVPGIAPIAVVDLALAGSVALYMVFDVGAPATLTKLRAVFASDAGAVTMGVCLWNPREAIPGVVVALGSGSGSGSVEVDVSADLVPQVYASFIITENDVTAKAILGTCLNYRLHDDDASGYSVLSPTFTLGAQAPAWEDYVTTGSHPVSMKFA